MSESIEKIVESAFTDVSAQRIARVYAEALYDAAAARNQGQEVFDELTALVTGVFQRDPGLEEYLSSGYVGRDHKKDLIEKTFTPRVSETFANFLLVLNHHDRLDLLRSIQLAFHDLAEERHGQMPVEVRSATPLSEQQVEQLKQELRDSFKRQPVLALKVDPDLLGGMTVKVGDWLYDATIRTQLETLQNQLIESSSHAIQSGRDRFSSSR
jgi:F-type H+-transporting ATPase subunit delta